MGSTTRGPKASRTTGLAVLAVLLGPALLAAPPAAGSPATCNAAYDRIEVTPMFADIGDTVAVRVFLRDTNEAPDSPDASNRVKVRFSAKYSDDLTELLGGTDERNIGGVFQKIFTVGTDAPSGRGTITIEILPPPTDDPLGLLNWCGSPTPPNSATKNWGFWVGQKPDLHVAATDTAVRLIEHRELLSDNLTHDPFESASLYTRYLPAQGVTCVEETTGDPGKLHFNVTIVNTGAADFRALDNGGELPLVVRVLDGTEVVGTQVFHLGLDAGAPGQGVLLDSSFFSLRNKTGIRDLRVQVDVGNVYKESVEDNNDHRSEVLDIMAPDLTGALTDVRNVNGLPNGKFSMTNVGNLSAGRVAAGQVCRSRNGEELFARVYLDKVAPEQQLRALDTGTDLFEVGEVVSDDFDGAGFPLSAGRHRVILVVDALPAPAPGGIADNANELSEANNTFVVWLEVPDLAAPVLHHVEVPAEGFAGRRLNITGIVTDDADFLLPGTEVALDMTFPDGANLTFFIPKEGGADAGFVPGNASDFHFWFNSTYDQVGTYLLRVRANDSLHTTQFPPSGQPPLRFRLAELPLSATLLSPIGDRLYAGVLEFPLPNGTGTFAAGTVQVNATAEGGAGVAGVAFLVDGKLRAFDTTAPYRFAWNTTEEPLGRHVLAARAYDRRGAFATDEVVVRVVPAGRGLLASADECRDLLSPKVCDLVGVPDLPLHQACRVVFSDLVCGALRGLG